MKNHSLVIFLFGKTSNSIQNFQLSKTQDLYSLYFFTYNDSFELVPDIVKNKKVD